MSDTTVRHSVTPLRVKTMFISKSEFLVPKKTKRFASTQDIYKRLMTELTSI